MSDQWSTGLFDCWDDYYLCCYIFTCCTSYIHLQSFVVGSLSNGCCHGDCINLFTGSVGMAYNRQYIRQTFGIKGSWCNDYYTVSYCPCCAVLQEYREFTKKFRNYRHGPIFDYKNVPAEVSSRVAPTHQT